MSAAKKKKGDDGAPWNIPGTIWPLGQPVKSGSRTVLSGARASRRLRGLEPKSKKRRVAGASLRDDFAAAGEDADAMLVGKGKKKVARRAHKPWAVLDTAFACSGRLMDIEIRVRLPPRLTADERQELERARQWVLEKHGTEKAKSQTGRVSLMPPKKKGRGR